MTPKTSEASRVVNDGSLVLPTVTAPPEVHADWLEWTCLRSPGHYSSWADHQRDLGIGGFDESEHDDADDAELERLIDDTAQELCERNEACQGTYPFEINSNGLSYNEGRSTQVYEFLLLLTLLGRNAAGSGQFGDRLFEELCTEAFHSYLGGSSAGLKSLTFGFPRRIPEKGFAGAVDRLCTDLGEGGGHKEVPESSDQKDAHLDVVVWRSFPDRKAGQLIAFGQCATGEDWFDKISELRPAKWCKLWLKDQPLVDPVPGFFTPRRIEPSQWRRASAYGGILFDRCRICWLLRTLSPSMLSEVTKWNKAVFEATS